jgi:hypothetical protein
MKSFLLAFCIACLFTTAYTALVGLSTGVNVTVPSPIISSSLSATYTTDSYFTWNRLRTTGGSYNNASEIYTLALSPTCQIKCAPFSYPVSINGGLYCQRDSSYYNGTNNYKNTNTVPQPFKGLCIPDVTIALGYCPLASHYLGTYSAGAGLCDYSLISVNNGIYPPYASTFDCCNNNQNHQSDIHGVNAYTDAGAIVYTP